MPTQPGTSTCKLKGMVFGAVVFGSGVVVASQHTNCNDLTIDGVPWEDASGYDCAVTPHPLYLGPACSVLCKQEMRSENFPGLCSFSSFVLFSCICAAQGYAYWWSQMAATGEHAADWCERFGGGVYGELVETHGHTVTSACCFCGLRSAAPTATPTVGRLRLSGFPHPPFRPLAM